MARFVPMLDELNPIGGETGNENKIQKQEYTFDNSAAETAPVAAGVCRPDAVQETVQKIQTSSQSEGVPQTANGAPVEHGNTKAPQTVSEFVPVQPLLTEAGRMYAEHGYLPGGFWVRLCARYLDRLICIIIGGCGYLASINLFGDYASRPFFFFLPLGGCVGFVFILLYSVLMTKLAGGTLGKLALRLKVVDVGTGEGISWWQAFFRETFGRLVSTVTVIGNLMALGDEHRTLNDHLSDTCVVYR